MYDYSYYSDTNILSGLLAGMMAFIGIFMLVLVAVCAVNLIATIKLYTKAGLEWWAAIIPIYNTVCMFQLVGLPVWLIVLAFVPFVNFAFVVLMFVVRFKLCKCYGASTGFAIASLFFGTICMLVLAFGKKYEYQGVV